MKKLLEQLRLFLLRKNLKHYRRTVSDSLKIMASFMPVAELEENAFYFHETQSAFSRFTSAPVLFKLISRFGTRETVFAWGTLCSNGGMVIPLGSCQMFFADDRLYQIKPVNIGAIFTVAVDNSEDRVVIYFDGKDVIAKKIEDAAGNEQYNFRPGSKPLWDKICLHAR